ncbi:MAG: hypothetical protein COA57_00420 [Flavobacteriales bacterium]|nr:diacylglycerol kinase family lipid kinase [Bacteroidales bacterium AH-315-I05]PCJ90049.1 MAG: hypothetical protein COA57_00420 [Flavobacteriales bacterium]
MMKAAFIVKGTINRKEKFLRDVDLLKQKAFFDTIEIFETQRKLHAIELAKDATEKGFSHVIAIGGDGTNNEVLNGIMQANTEALPVMGCLPYGSANDFVLSAGLNDDIHQFIQLIEQNKSKRIDIGKVDFQGKEGLPVTRYYMNISDIGLGGYTVEKMGKTKPVFGTAFTFFRVILESFLTYKKTPLRCFNDSFNWEGKSLMLVVANGNFFGNGLCVAPDAKLDDGKLNLVILGDVSTFDYIKNLGNLKKCRKIQHPEVSYHKIESIEVDSGDHPCPIDMDGEFIGYGPATFSVVPKKVEFLMP